MSKLRFIAELRAFYGSYIVSLAAELLVQYSCIV